MVEFPDYIHEDKIDWAQSINLGPGVAVDAKAKSKIEKDLTRLKRRKRRYFFHVQV